MRNVALFKTNHVPISFQDKNEDLERPSLPLFQDGYAYKYCVGIADPL
jgi:hypothetical protein